MSANQFTLANANNGQASQTISLRCSLCDDEIWIGQRSAGSDRLWIYNSDEVIGNLSLFLDRHIGHRLMFTNDYDDDHTTPAPSTIPAPSIDNLIGQVDYFLSQLAFVNRASTFEGVHRRAAELRAQIGQYRTEAQAGQVIDLSPVYEPLDAGIAPVVDLLRSCRFNTTTSCEGGQGHAFGSPTVRIKPIDPERMPEEMARIAVILSDAGYGGYYLKACHSYQQGPEPWKPGEMSFIELEFWLWAEESGSGSEESYYEKR